MPVPAITLSGRSNWDYPVFVDSGLCSDLTLWRTLLDKKEKVALVTDTNVDLHVVPCFQELISIIQPVVSIVKAGEASKNRDVKATIETDWIRGGIGRDGIAIAVGGGVVGDLTGFCAATYLRGIPVIQVPTSLVAMVDSSIGGKTGIDIPEGKNLVGAFHPPSAVVADVGTLKTLPDDELRYGLAEVIKHAVIADADLFQFVGENLDGIFNRESDVLCELIRRNVQIKGNVVQEDEKEGGLRQILNLGHTIGHAIEHLCHFELPHGVGVALGTLAELQMAVALRGFPADQISVIKDLFQKIGLATTISDSRVTADSIIDATSTDKKVRKGQVRYSLPDQFGAYTPDIEAGYAMPVPKNILSDALRHIC